MFFGGGWDTLDSHWIPLVGLLGSGVSGEFEDIGVAKNHLTWEPVLFGRSQSQHVRTVQDLRGFVA